MNMISTGTFLPEMDASDKQETVAEKFARVWEKKNAKAARAGGVSLMALSLAACGSSSEETTVVIEEDEAETPAEPTVVNHTLTNDALPGVGPDNIAGVAGANDIITSAAGTLDATDDIIDNDATDADVLNVTLTAAGAAADIDGIETINVNFDQITGASFDATNVTGATINLSSSRFGFDGAAQVTASGANAVSAGTGITNLTVTDAGAGSIDIGSATTVAIDTAAYTATTTSRELNIVVNGATSTTFGVDYDMVATTDDAVLNLTSTADTTLTYAPTYAQAIAAGSSMTINMDDGVTLRGDADLFDTTASGFATYTVTGGNISLNAATAGTLTATNFTDTNITVATTDTLAIAGAASLGTITLAAASADLTLTGSAATGETVTVDVTRNQPANTNLDFDVAGASIENAVVNLAAPSATDVIDTIAALDFAGNLTLNVANDVVVTQLTTAGTAAGGAFTDDLVIAGTGDVDLTGGSPAGVAANNAAAGGLNVDASQLNGGITFLGTVAASNQTLVGGSGDDTITSNGATNVVDMSGGAGDDTLTSVVTTGTATIQGGAGDDTINAGITAAGVGTLTSGTARVDAGAGDDTINLGANASGTVVVDGGAGDDTVVLSGDASLTAGVADQAYTLTNVETVDLNGAARSMLASDLNGATFTVTDSAGGGSAALTILEDGTGGMTLDISGITFDTTAGQDVATTSLDLTTGVSSQSNVITLGAANDAIDLVGTVFTYTDSDTTINTVTDGDTYQAAFTTISGFNQGTVAGGAVTAAADTIAFSGVAAHATTAGIIIVGEWDAATQTFTVNDAAGTDTLILDSAIGNTTAGFYDGTEVGVVLLETTGIIA